MEKLKVLTMTEQVAAHLAEQVELGRWTGLMPGRDRLARELGVNRKTVEAALVQLERQGLLKAQGPGRRRLIQRGGGGVGAGSPRMSLTIGFLFHDVGDQGEGYLIDLRHRLEDKGHRILMASKSLTDLGMKPTSVARLVARNPADAWVVLGGSFEVLEGFLARRQPVFALFGRRRELMISGVGPDKPPAYAAAARELIRLGHRRIVLLCAPERRVPEPGASERAFLSELAAHGIPLSRFQLPDWDGSIDGFYRRLDLLFRVTPPTALILDEVRLFAAAQSFLSHRGLRVPADVSLICTDYGKWFDWCRPTVSHIRWDSRPVVNCIVRWATGISRGQDSVRQMEVPAEFVPRGTIGKPPRVSRQRR